MTERNRIWSIEDIDSDIITDSIYDVALFACGYEERCTYMPSLIAPTHVGTAIVLAFEDMPNVLAHQRNLEFFEERWPGTTLHVNSNDDAPLYARLRELGASSSPLRLLIDYSGMSRVWYNAVLNWLHHTPLSASVAVHFVYARGTYTDAHQPLRIGDILALPGCEAEHKSGQRTVAIVGLGFDASVALGVLDRIEPDVVRAFFASPGSAPEDAEKALFTNQSFISEHASVSLALPIASVEATVRALQEVVAPELGRENIILIPLGPKPHVLACIILARLHERELTCVRVSGTRSPVAASATGEVVATRVVWVPELGFEAGLPTESGAPPG